MSKGIFCISIDTELYWSRKVFPNRNYFLPKIKRERALIKKLLFLFRKYKIPVTWAIVGKLYEKNSDKLLDGRDIINWIKKDKIHELASHSYSHKDFSQITGKEAIKEFSKPKAKTFVFPRNRIAYLSLLKKAGFIAYRNKDASEIELILPRIPITAKIIKQNNSIAIPSSMYFTSARKLKRLIPPGLRYLKSILGINRAIKRKEIFHIWFHPVDLADNSEGLFKELEKILIYANKKRQQGLLDIKTMKDIAE